MGVLIVAGGTYDCKEGMWPLRSTERLLIINENEIRKN
jgi:hypothetical protein